MRILLFGCGWLGKQVVNQLLADKHFVLALTKSSKVKIPNSKFEHGNFDVESDDFNKLDFASFDKIILCLNPQYLNPPFLDSLKLHPHILVISSISIYGNQGLVDETTTPTPFSTNGKRLFQLENQYPSFTFLRLGGLVGPGRNPSQFLKQKENVTLKNEVINLVHSFDVVSILAKLIQENDLAKKINLVAPFHPKKEVFYGALLPHLIIKTELNETGKQVKSVYEKD